MIFAWLTVAASLALWPLGHEPDLRRHRASSWARSSWSRRTGCAGRVRRGEPVKPMRLFHWSTTYLTILFVAVAVDASRSVTAATPGRSLAHPADGRPNGRLTRTVAGIASGW